MTWTDNNAWRDARVRHLRQLAADAAADGDIDTARLYHRQADDLMAAPLLLGGQGRSPREVRDDAFAVGWTIALIVALVSACAGVAWGWGSP